MKDALIVAHFPVVGIAKEIFDVEDALVVGHSLAEDIALEVEAFRVGVHVLIEEVSQVVAHTLAMDGSLAAAHTLSGEASLVVAQHLALVEDTVMVYMPVACIAEVLRVYTLPIVHIVGVVLPTMQVQV